MIFKAWLNEHWNALFDSLSCGLIVTITDSMVYEQEGAFV
jgi:hypothetical protein